MRALLLFVIGLVFGGAGGFLLSGNHGMEGHDHAGHGDASHDHSALTPWPADQPVPTVLLHLKDDGPTSRNLFIMSHDWDWLPDDVNGPVTSGGGHAHIYVNGAKVARAYGPWFHLDDLPATGPTTIRVTFNANDHSGWSIAGVPLAAEVTIP